MKQSDYSVTAEESDPDNERIRSDYEFRAGAFVRGRVRFHVERAAGDYEVNVKILEDRMLLASEFCIRISGPRTRVHEFYNALDKWVTDNER